MKQFALIPALFLTGAIGALAQTYTFQSVTSVSPAADGALDGWQVRDSLKGNDYSGGIGEMGLLFEDASPVSGMTGTPNGTFRGDAGGSLANRLGLFAYCVDSDAPFSTTSSSTPRTLVAYTVAAAESRYRAEVNYYLPGALKRAAYLMESFGQTAHNGGDVEAAALQAAIWESLYDSTVNVTQGNGDYYLRTTSGDSAQQSRTTETRNLANTWLNSAVANQWGGSNYDPANRVLVWMDPTDASNFQSVMTIKPSSAPIQAIPEPSAALLLLAGGLFAMRRRR